MSSPKRCATKEQLLVTGFLRAIEFLLANNLMNVIPDGLLLLCYQFYKSCIKLGIIYHGQPPPASESSTYDKRKTGYGVMDIVSRSIMHYSFIDNYPNVSDELLINDICQKIPKQFFEENKYHRDKIIDGIICKLGKHPCILLLEQNDHKNRIIHYLSNATMPRFKDMLYCDERNSIFAEYNGILYQLKLSDIIDNNFEFMMIKDGADFLHCSCHSGTYLKLEYLQGMDKLFGIRCTSNPFFVQKYMVHQERQCAIYDFDKNEWNNIAPFKYEWNNGLDKFACITAYDENLNVIYMQSNIGYTAKYDCNKDEWIILLNENKKKDVNYVYVANTVRGMGKLWIEGDVLKWIKRSKRGEIMVLDLSVCEEDRKWVKESDPINYDSNDFAIFR